MSTHDVKCRHFNGIQHNVCRAGVSYSEMRDVSGSPTRWPCLRLPGQAECKTSCAQFSALTIDEMREQRAAATRAIEAALADRCPTCGAELVVQENESVVVKACKVHGFVMRGCKRISERNE